MSAECPVCPKADLPILELSPRQLFANATIAASRVADIPPTAARQRPRRRRCRGGCAHPVSGARQRSGGVEKYSSIASRQAPEHGSTASSPPVSRISAAVFSAQLMQTPHPAARAVATRLVRYQSDGLAHYPSTLAAA